MKNECSFYNSRMLDLSQFQSFYKGIDCTTYEVGATSFI